jgi:alpha-glucosidase
MNDWNGRDVTFDLPFDAADGTAATLWRDGANAHRNGQDYRKETVTVKDNKVTVHLAPGGGCVLVF